MPESDALYRIVVCLGIASFAVAVIVDAILNHGPKAWAILSSEEPEQ